MGPQGRSPWGPLWGPRVVYLGATSWGPEVRSCGLRVFSGWAAEAASCWVWSSHGCSVVRAAVLLFGRAFVANGGGLASSSGCLVPVSPPMREPDCFMFCVVCVCV